MSEAFGFSLTEEEKAALRDLVRLSIARRLSGRDGARPLPEAPSARLCEPLGAFVTLKLHGNLRGCIGRIIGDAPLWFTITEMAQAAAFGDPRFSPLTAGEFAEVELEISILSPVTVCPDPKLVEVGRHGLIMRRGERQGLLLPQVPLEWGWDRERFLDQTCRKAGLPPEAWRDKGTEIFWFEAEIL